jgi:hypothetical protein
MEQLLVGLENVVVRGSDSLGTHIGMALQLQCIHGHAPHDDGKATSDVHCVKTAEGAQW